MLPQRIVSVVPSQTELLFALGLDEQIVGVTKFCIHPADKVRSKAIIGGTKTLHPDRIDALQPDLIIANKEENTREQIAELGRRYAVHVTDVATLPGALAMIREIGTLVGKGPEADQMADQIAGRFARIPPAGEPRPTVAYLIWRKPYMVAAGATFIDAMLRAAGFQNAFADQKRYPDVSPDALREARPDWVFLSSEPYPFGQKHVSELRTICPSAGVRLVDGEVFSWYGSRLLRAADYLTNLRQETARPP